MRLLNTLKQYWFIVITILLITCLIPLYSENLYKVLIITFIVLLWCILGIILKKFTLSSLLILLLILPFNITYQLPYSVGNLIIANPYADGLFVNYLVPTVSILDIGVFLLLISICFENVLSIKWRGFAFIKVFILFVLFLLIQNIFVGNFLSIFISIRWLVYIFTFYQLSKNFKKLVLDKKKVRDKTLIYILILSLILVVVQGLIALIQFKHGSSLGLSILGESQVVSGMRGSSFISLNNQFYLRGYGTFPHPNVFGGWLVFNIFLGWFMYQTQKIKKGYPIILMLLSSLVISLTFSRLSYLIMGIIWGAFLFNIFRKINKRKKRETKEFGMVGLISERVLNLFAGGDNSWSERVDLIRSSMEVIKDNLVVGTGLGKFISSMGAVVKSEAGIFILQPVHNIFLLLFSELGIIGFGLFSTLLYFFIKSKNFNVRFITVLICLLIWGMFDHYWISLPQGQILMLFLLII